MTHFELETMMGARVMRYSPQPPEHYSVELNGVRYGWGARTEFQQNLALWNLFFLNYLDLEDILTIPPLLAEEAPVYCDLIPACHATLAQQVGKQRVEDLVTGLAPRRFIEFLGQHDYRHLALAEYWECDWLGVMRHRAELYRGVTAVSGNVIVANFGK